ncbi:hypothetical protein DLM45_15320 [Hyphomicrobium methylovorum]|nr:hypothetical protein [Hyphomicrobium methylovorum]
MFAYSRYPKGLPPESQITKNYLRIEAQVAPTSFLAAHMHARPGEGVAGYRIIEMGELRDCAFFASHPEMFAHWESIMDQILSTPYSLAVRRKLQAKDLAELESIKRTK